MLTAFFVLYIKNEIRRFKGTLVKRSMVLALFYVVAIQPIPKASE